MPERVFLCLKFGVGMILKVEMSFEQFKQYHQNLIDDGTFTEGGLKLIYEDIDKNWGFHDYLDLNQTPLVSLYSEVQQKGKKFDLKEVAAIAGCIDVGKIIGFVIESESIVTKKD